MNTNLGRLGFSLVEMLVATALLGVGLTGLVRMYTTAARGVAENEARALGIRAAAQRAEALATMTPEALPACSGAPTCRDADGLGFTTDLGPAGAFECTRWVDGPDVAGPGAAAQARGTRLRVDTHLAPHPETSRHEDALVLTVSVCWADGGGRVHEVQTRRVLVPGA